MRFLIGVTAANSAANGFAVSAISGFGEFVLAPAQTFGFAEAPPPAWATAGLLLLAVAALCLALRWVRRWPRANAAPAKSPHGDLRGSAALTRSGEAARRRLGLADAPPHS